MKKLFVASIFIILILIASLLGCSISLKSSDIATENSDVKMIKVFVELSSSVSKMPEIVNNTLVQNEATRSAVPSELKDLQGDNLMFACSIHDGTLTGEALEKSLLKCDFNSEDNSIMIPFEKSSVDRLDYTLEVFAYESSYNFSSGFSLSSSLLNGKTSISIPANATSATAQKIVLAPVTTSTVKGSATLLIKIPQEYKLICSSENFDCTGPDLSGVYVVKSKAGGLAAGAYPVSLFIMNRETLSTDKLSSVYAWTETINVYPGMVTDVWSASTSTGGTSKELVITVSKITSTFYVRGASGDNWFLTNVSTAESGNDTTGNGSIAKPYATVQKALEKISAITGGGVASFTIFVDGEVTLPPESSGDGYFVNIAPSGILNLSIIGLDASSNATLNSNFTTARTNGSVINATGSNLDLTLKNLKVTGGNTTGNGGGINFSGKKLTITKCEISGNTALNGGGIYNNGGTVVIKESVIKSNVATGDRDAEGGGGLYNLSGTIEVNNDADISRNTAIRGGGIYNLTNGKVIVTGGKINNNIATGTSGKGGGIYNNGTSIVEMSGGEIKENVASSTGGGGIFNIGSSTIKVTGGVFNGNSGFAICNFTDSNILEMSAGAKIDANNAVLLCSDAFITIAGDFTTTGTVAWVELDRQDKYVVGTQIIVADRKPNISITENICQKFVLAKYGDSTTICSDFVIEPNSDKTKGVLVHPDMEAVVTLPGNYTFDVGGLSNGKIAVNKQLSFSVKSSSGTIPSDATYSITLQQNGADVVSATGANGTGNKITIPSWLNAGLYTVMMVVTVNGKEYDYTIQIEVTK